MERTYTFKECEKNNIKHDPVFKNKKFKLYDVGSIADDAKKHCELYFVEDYFYALFKPSDVDKDEDMLFRIACYLFHHPNFHNDSYIVYIIGDKNVLDNFTYNFSNHTVKLISYEEINNWFPKNIEDIFRLVIRYILRFQKYYGQNFSDHVLQNIYLFCIDRNLSDTEQTTTFKYLKTILFEEEYLIQTSPYPALEFCLSPLAIDKYQEKENEISKKAFVALKFGTQNKKRIRIIKEIISSCGYEPICMDEYQTNNWIMPEIFYQIKICDFMVVDFSIECAGAYYEAGYGLALNKQVIHMFDERESINNKLHFDIEQKHTIFYKDYNDLKKRLTERIKSTIGINDK